MERIYNQVKRIIDNLNFDKIYKDFKKCKFILKIHNNYYCNDITLLNEVLLPNNDVNQKYVIYEIKSNEIIIKDIVLNVVIKMFEMQFKINQCSEQCLTYLLTKKDSNYFTKKYQQSLLMVNILKGNDKLLNKYVCLLNERQKNPFITDIEEVIEKNIGLKKYVELKLLEIFKPEEYKYELRFILDKLEDPCNLLNYINYSLEFSVVYLLIQNKIWNIKINDLTKNDDKPLFSFDKLILQKDKQTKKFLMHKMINAKKTYLKGKIINIDFKNVNACDDLLYLPNEITILYNNKKITKKGEFILQINEQLEIIGGYECLSLEKILI